METYDFPIAEKKLSVVGLAGIEVPNKAIVRTDKNMVLGVMGEDYQLVPHKTVIQAFEKDLKAELTKRSVTLCKDGAVMFAKYETPRIKAVEVKKGDVVKFGIEVFNSYDGSLPVGFMFTALQLICLNGATIPRSIARISVKHTANVSLDNIEKAFTERLPLFIKTSEKWNEWAQTTPKKNRVEEFFKASTGDRLCKHFQESYEGLSDKTVWGIYSMVTHYITHEIKVRKNNEQNRRLAQLAYEKNLINDFYNFLWR